MGCGLSFVRTDVLCQFTYIFELFSLAAARLDGQKGTVEKEILFLKYFGIIPPDVFEEVMLALLVLIPSLLR